MRKIRKRQLRKMLSSTIVLALTLPSLLGVMARGESVVEKVHANGNGLVVTKTVNKDDVWRDFPEDRLVGYRVDVENTLTCEDAPIDAMLVLDRSGSMDDDSLCVNLGGNPVPVSKPVCDVLPGLTWLVQPLQDAKDAAKDFVDLLSSPTDYAGLVSYSTNATLDQELTSNHGAVKTAIDGMNANGWTNIGQGLEFAHTEFTNNGRPGSPDYAVPVIILLTDGSANVNEAGTGTPDVSGGEAYAEVEADAAKADGIRVIVIGLGDDVNGSWLENEIASSPSDYYPAPNSSDLSDIYISIQETLGDSVDTVLTDNISDILLDADFWYATDGGIFDPMTETITWDLGTLFCLNDRGKSSKYVDFWVVVQGDAPDGDIMENMATVTNMAGAYAESNMVYTEIHALDKIDSDDPVVPGQTFTYTIDWATVSMGVEDVEIIDYMDPRVEFVSASDGGVYDGGSHTITWNLGPKASYQQGYITLDVRVEDPWTGSGALYNEASIQLIYEGIIGLQYPTTGTPGGPAWVDEYTDVLATPAVEILKTDDPDPVEAGATLSYTLTYENTGNMVLYDVEITDTLPAGLTYIPGTSEIDTVPVGDPAGADPSYTWDFGTLLGDGTLLPDGPHTLIFDVTADETLADGTVLTDEAVIYSYYLGAEEEMQGISSDDTEDTTVVVPFLDITKDNDADDAGENPGATVTFTIVVTNNGTTDATGVTITDTLPDGVTLVAGSSTLNGVAVGDPTGTNPFTWNGGTLPADGGTATLTYDITVDADATEGVYSNGSYADAENILDPTDLVTSTFTVVIPEVLGEETEPEGEVLGATGSAAIIGMMFGLMLLGASTVVVKKKR